MPKKSRAEELAGRAVPNGEGEHAAQAVEHGLAPGQVAHEQNFGIGIGGEFPAVGGKLGAQVAVVVDLAVEDDRIGPARRRAAGVGAGRARGRAGGRGDFGRPGAGRADHGLAAAFEVDQGEAAMPQRNAVGHVEPLAVGPAMRHDRAHGRKDGFVPLACIGESADAAHGSGPLPLVRPPRAMRQAAAPEEPGTRFTHPAIIPLRVPHHTRTCYIAPIRHNIVNY